MKWSSLEETFEFSCIHCTLHSLFLKGEGPILEYADYILQDDFFNRIEITHIADKLVRREFTHRARICRVNRSYLMQPVIFGKKLNPHSQLLEERKRSLHEMNLCLEEAAEIEADTVLFCSGPNDSEDEKVVTQAYVDLIEALSERASVLGLKLLLEPFDDRVDKKRWIGSNERLKLLMEETKHIPNFSLVAELSHFPLLHETVASMMEEIGNHLGHVHIGNCVLTQSDARYGDSHPYFGYPQGCNDVNEVADFFYSLTKVGYLGADRAGSVGIEIIPQQDERIVDVLMNAKRTVRKAWINAKHRLNSEGIV
ncbi:sugar phosphate isomerase/epimerase family protein [Paenibacillus sp. JSM ZJ436]|uniref:sugar phosphate isomerase/epimerase family protein n=1 Tax=Paenibacillus sp. JSM ZJ436 TaxID=3376190 RepID=UPI00379DC718